MAEKVVRNIHRKYVKFGNMALRYFGGLLKYSVKKYYFTKIIPKSLFRKGGLPLFSPLFKGGFPVVSPLF